MKIELTIKEPIKPPKPLTVDSEPKDIKAFRESKYRANSRYAATVKVNGKNFGDEYVGETEKAAVTAFFKDMLRADAQTDMIADLLKVK